MKLKLIYFGCFLLAVSQTVQAEPVVGGYIPLFQIPPTPVEPQDPPTFELQTPAAIPPTTSASSTKIRVNAIELTGAKIYEQSQVLASWSATIILTA